MSSEQETNTAGKRGKKPRRERGKMESRDVAASAVTCGDLGGTHDRAERSGERQTALQTTAVQR